MSGVRPSNISAIENDRRVPSADTLNRLLVACGFEPAAAAGNMILYCRLPRAGWFPDDDHPSAEPGDPIDEAPSLDLSASVDERRRAVIAALDLAEATRP